VTYQHRYPCAEQMDAEKAVLYRLKKYWLAHIDDRINVLKTIKKPMDMVAKERYEELTLLRKRIQSFTYDRLYSNWMLDLKDTTHEP
jgi:hypothetical protein